MLIQLPHRITYQSEQASPDEVFVDYLADDHHWKIDEIEYNEEECRATCDDAP